MDWTSGDENCTSRSVAFEHDEACEAMDASVALSTSREKLRNKVLEVLQDAPHTEKKVRNALLQPAMEVEKLPPRKRNKSTQQRQGEAQGEARGLHDFSYRRFVVKGGRRTEGEEQDELQKMLQLPTQVEASEFVVADTRGGATRWRAAHAKGKRFAAGAACEARDEEELQDKDIDAAWFRATVVDRRVERDVPLEDKDTGKTDTPTPRYYLIEYKDFVEDEETKVPLRAVLESKHVRPPLPSTAVGAGRVKALGTNTEAEAEWQDGWYPASLLEYNEEKKMATVQFRATRVIQEVQEDKVRVSCTYQAKENTWKIDSTGQNLPWV